MTIEDKYIKQQLVGELRARQAEAPDFEAVWRASEARYLAGRRRYRNSMALVAAAVVALIVVLPPEDGDRETPDLLTAEAVLTSTQWQAPSDSLMPQHVFDVYEAVPSTLRSTKLLEGTLL